MEQKYLFLTTEAKCLNGLAQQVSTKEVVVWVNEDGEPIDPSIANSHAPIAQPVSEYTGS